MRHISPKSGPRFGEVFLLRCGRSPERATFLAFQLIASLAGGGNGALCLGKRPFGCVVVLKYGRKHDGRHDFIGVQW
ncbi:MAG: hypothetical protein GY805_38270 [Chloroflexi bacterium]|nr:hypothetical protein [Chloroflexota bacterium]